MRAKLPFRFKVKRKNLGMWGIILLIIVVGVLAYVFREPLSKSFVFKKAGIEEATEPVPPTFIVPSPSLESSQETNLKIGEEGKVIKEEASPKQSEEKEAEKKEGSEKKEKIYVETAEYGEGITHLARKALKEYLKEKGENLHLTKAHRIYIEDYMQNKTGDRWLKLGEKISFSESLIEEAIQHAMKLTDAQLQNILNYTPPPTFVE